MLDAHRDAAAVVGDPDDLPREDFHLDVGAVASKRLVYRVVYNFIDQMMQAPGAGGADVHAGPFADSLQPFQHLDLVFIICFGLWCVLHGKLSLR